MTNTNLTNVKGAVEVTPAQVEHMLDNQYFLVSGDNLKRGAKAIRFDLTRMEIKAERLEDAEA